MKGFESDVCTMSINTYKVIENKKVPIHAYIRTHEKMVSF